MSWEYVSFIEAVDILDNVRKPINSKERASRIEGKSTDELYPYYGATGQVGYIDSYLSDGEYVLLGEDGAPFLNPLAKKAYIINGKAWVNNHAHILRSKTNNHFLCYYLNYIDYKGLVSGTTRLKLTQSQMKQIKIPVPPIQEQKRIVARIEKLFSNLDSAVETLQKTKQQLEVYRQAVLRKAFSEFDSNTYIILNNIIEKPRYGTSKKCTYDQTDNSISVYRIPNIDYRLGCIDTTDLKYADFTNEELKKIDLQTNDLLMIRSNGSVSLVGRTAIVSQANNNDTFAGYLIRLRFINPSIYRAKFLHYYLQSHNARIYIENVAKSTSGVNNINSDEISKIPIPWGDDDRIKHVVCNIDRYLSISNNICNTVDEALHQAEAMRQSILKQAFEGDSFL